MQHRDKEFLEYLGGIFLLSLIGLEFFLKNEKKLTPNVTKTKESYRDHNNSTIKWAKKRCLIGHKYKAAPPDLWKDYKKWCEDSGLKKKGKRNFYEDIRLNYDVEKKRKNTRDYWVGIALRQDDDNLSVC